jgi:alkanesulfonate monooxygenase SsuD/methylene tetrahydromethanopterin reductase-like flavin-dependent oxidoreductase (luciferase family)
MRSLGVVFQPAFEPERMLGFARAADEAGIQELWLWEDCFRESGIASTTAILAATPRIRVAIGVLPLPLRNVAITAMELATIERLFPGRLIAGFGHGVQDWMGQVGARVASPLTLMNEALPALRALLGGETVTVDGRYVQLDRVALDWPPAAAPPIVAGGEGPKTLALAGALADGTVIPSGWGPERFAAAAAATRTGAGDRAAEHGVSVFVLTAFGDDRSRLDADLRPDASADDRIVALGSPQQVAQTVEAYYAAGATSVVLQPASTEPDLEGFAASAGEVAAVLGLRV